MAGHDGNDERNVGAGLPRRWPDLVDDALLQEIELLMHVIAAVAAHTCPLTGRQVDAVLGIDRRGEVG